MSIDKYRYVGDNKDKYGTIYHLWGEVKVKDLNTREWYDGIIYFLDDTAEFYVREKNDFKNNFELIR